MQRAKAGYTLLEVLIVLVILSIVAASALVRLGFNQDKHLERAAKNLVETLSLAEEQALLKPATLGVVISRHHYAVYQAKGDQDWNLVEKKTLPEGVELHLWLAGKEAKLSESKTNKPQLLIYNNGSLSPFRLLLCNKGDKKAYEVEALADGSLKSHIYRSAA